MTFPALQIHFGPQTCTQNSYLSSNFQLLKFGPSYFRNVIFLMSYYMSLIKINRITDMLSYQLVHMFAID